MERESDALFRRWDEADLEDLEDHVLKVQNLRERLAAAKKWVEEDERKHRLGPKVRSYSMIIALV